MTSAERFKVNRENNVNAYPERIMRILRQRRGLDEFDVTEDSDINVLSSKEAFSEVCIWEGFLGSYDSEIKGWIKDIYKIDLD